MQTSALPPTGLMVNLLGDPGQTVIRTPEPRFSWIVNDSDRQAFQTSWQIQVASSLNALLADEADMWDSGAPDPRSGWRTDERSLHLPYDGNPLKPDAPYFWRVRTWNHGNQASPWSEPQSFRTATLSDSHETDRQDLVLVEQPPRQVVRRTDGVVFVDFGKAAFGTVRLRLTAEKDSQITIRLGEVLRSAFTIETNPGGSRRFRSLTLSVYAGTKSYSVEIPPDKRNTHSQPDERRAAAILMPKRIGEVLPFRYCEIEGVVRPLQRSDITRLAAEYPLDDDASHFQSSSTLLDDVWDMSRYSMRATSFCGVHVDGDRERIPYEGDCYINQLGVYGCHREYALSRYSHEYLITHPTWPTEWVLFSVQTAWLDYLYTGDPASLEHHYNDLQAKTLAALARSDGLISTVSPPVPAEVLEAIHFHPQWTIRDIIDWPQGERDQYDMRPVNTVVNAFHWRALVLMARIAAALQRRTDARSWRERAERVRASMLDTLVDSRRHLFTDGEGSDHCSLHATVFPLAFGLTPESMTAAATAWIRAKGMACSVYAAQFLLEALYRAGDDLTAMSLLTSTAERSWAHWIYEVGTTVSLEAWGDRFKPNQDWNHAWGASPANIIPRFVLGVRPLQPGFAKIAVEPRPGDLAHVRGTVPTIRGPVSVVVNQDPGRRFALAVTLPANTVSRVSLPKMHARDHTICVDGSDVTATPSGNALVLDGIGSGAHTLVRA